MILHLFGGKSVYTSDSISTYTVVRGEVLAFLTCCKDGAIGKRLYLGQFSPDACIPSIHYTDDEGVLWQLVLVALDNAEVMHIEGIPSSTAYSDFAASIGLPEYSRLGIEEALAEKYRLTRVKDDAFIYQTEKDERQAYSDGLQQILNVFAAYKHIEYDQSPNRLYNSVALLCKKQRIKVAPYADISAITEAPSIDDIARISDFIARKITLDDNWHTKDVGSFLSFDRDNGEPIAIISKGSGRYIAYSSGGMEQRVTNEVAQQISDEGYSLYRPLPARILTNKDVLKYIAQTLRWRDFFGYLLMLLLSTVIGLLLPELNRMLYDRYIPAGDEHGLLQIGILLFAFSVSNILFSVTGNLASFRFSSYPKYAIEAAIYHRVLNLPQNEIGKMESGDLASRVMGLGELLCSLVDSFISSCLSFLMSLLYLVRMLTYSDALSAIAILMLSISVLLSFVLAVMQIRYARKEMELRSEINSNLYQCLGGIAKIRLSGATTNALLRHMKKYAQYKSLDYKGNRLSIITNALSGLMSAIMTIALYSVVISHLGSITSGSFMAFNSAFGSFSSAVMTVFGLVTTIIQVKPLFERVSFLFSTAPESSEAKELPGHLTGEIDISNVSFAYAEGEDHVLHNINTVIKAGEYVGIVGPSGCGKSTLIKLLLGFEKPTIGRIYYDGKDISMLEKRELRKQIGIVLQNGSLISGSIQENITITAPGTSLERVEEVVREVGLSEDIEMMPMGLHTILSEDGETISGGQKQRILIARALANKPSIVILDEATSALDNVTQNLVTDTLSRLTSTRIVIAHRLSTVIKCDRIIVMENGRVVEQGNYDELMARKGTFWQFAKRQIA